MRTQRPPTNSRQLKPDSLRLTSLFYKLKKQPNAVLQRPADNCIVRQVVDERYADSSPLQALVGFRLGMNHSFSNSSMAEARALTTFCLFGSSRRYIGSLSNQRCTSQESAPPISIRELG